jgi:hypothetical protein
MLHVGCAVTARTKTQDLTHVVILCGGHSPRMTRGSFFYGYSAMWVAFQREVTRANGTAAGRDTRPLPCLVSSMD